MFLLEKKHPIEADIILDILKSEKIPYKLKSIKQESLFFPPKILGYDIEIYSDLEHFDYAKKLISERMNHINQLEKIFNTITADDVLAKNTKFLQVKVSEYKPKKSLLKRIIDRIKDV